MAKAASWPDLAARFAILAEECEQYPIRAHHADPGDRLKMTWWITGEALNECERRKLGLEGESKRLPSPPDELARLKHIQSAQEEALAEFGRLANEAGRLLTRVKKAVGDKVPSSLWSLPPLERWLAYLHVARGAAGKWYQSGAAELPDGSGMVHFQKLDDPARASWLLSARLASLSAGAGESTAATKPSEKAARATGWDAATEARNKWIYSEGMKGTAWASILRKLTEKSNSWSRIETIQGLREAADAYATRLSLPRVPSRHPGRLRPPARSQRRRSEKT